MEKEKLRKIEEEKINLSKLGINLDELKIQEEKSHVQIREKLPKLRSPNFQEYVRSMMFN